MEELFAQHIRDDKDFQEKTTVIPTEVLDEIQKLKETQELMNEQMKPVIKFFSTSSSVKSVILSFLTVLASILGIVYISFQILDRLHQK